MTWTINYQIQKAEKKSLGRGNSDGSVRVHETNQFLILA